MVVEFLEQKVWDLVPSTSQKVAQKPCKTATQLESMPQAVPSTVQLFCCALYCSCQTSCLAGANGKPTPFAHASCVTACRRCSKCVLFLPLWCYLEHNGRSAELAALQMSGHVPPLYNQFKKKNNLITSAKLNLGTWGTIELSLLGVTLLIAKNLLSGKECRRASRTSRSLRTTADDAGSGRHRGTSTWEILGDVRHNAEYIGPFDQLLYMGI